MGGSSVHRGVLNLNGLPEARTRGDELRNCFFNKPIEHQTECRGEERRFPRSHSSDVVRQQLGILPGEGFVEELDFHVHNRGVTEDSSVRKADEESRQYPPRGKGGKELLHNVRSREL